HVQKRLEKAISDILESHAAGSQGQIGRVLEKDEILADKTTPVTISNALAQYLISFNQPTVAKLRHRLRTNDADDVDNIEGDNNSLSVRRWIYKTVLSMADILAIDGVEHTESERWYEIHIWKMIDDYVLKDCDINLTGGESTSCTTAYRKNSVPRASTDKRKMGRRIDGLYTSLHHSVEVGGIELGPEEQDSTGRKYQQDSLKLQKLWKDQFDYALIHTSAVKRDFAIMGLQLLGYFAATISIECHIN
ncbi:hypothetical protein BGX27_003385, partial [Mortierella sp. AM989]